MALANDTLALCSLPRTGTTWFEAVCRNAGSPLISGRKHVIDGRCVGRRVVCIVRRPEAWLASLYTHLTNCGHWSILGPAQALVGTPCDWPTFCDRIIERPRVVEYVYRAYLDVADVVLRTESLAADVAKELPQLAAACRETPPVNESSNLPTWYLDQSRALESSERTLYRLLAEQE